MDRQQSAWQPVPLLSQQTHHIRFHVHRYETQHNSIVPVKTPDPFLNTDSERINCEITWMVNEAFTNLIEEESKVSKFHSLVYISILAHNKWRFTSKL